MGHTAIPQFRCLRRARFTIMKRIYATFLVALLIATLAPECQGQYATDWVANTFGTNATRVGSAARSMWIAEVASFVRTGSASF
jgi:hypothetical protein